MSRRLPRLLLAALTLNGALVAGALAAPGLTFACSCMVTGPEAIGKVKGDPDTVVFIGTVESVEPDLANQFGHTIGVLVIDRVYQGDIPSARMQVVGGGGGDCTMHLEAGQRMITAAAFSDGVITPGLCRPYGDPLTAEGRQLMAEAERAFGVGWRPPDAPPASNDPPAAPTVAAELGLLLILASIIGVVIALFGGIALVARRGRGAA